MTIPLPPVPGREVVGEEAMNQTWFAWFNQLYAFLTQSAAGGGGILNFDTKILTTAPLEGGGPLKSNPTLFIEAGGIGNSLLASMPPVTFKGNPNPGTGGPQDLTAAQLVVLLDIINLIQQNSIFYPQTSVEAGLVPPVVPLSTKYPNGPFRYGAVGTGAPGTAAQDTLGWQTMVRVNGIHTIPDGDYLITATIASSSFTTLIGWTRQNTILNSQGFSGPILQIGAAPSGPNPNAGAIQRVRFFGATGNTACLYMQQLSHLWRLDDLLFQNSPCPALINNNCWDANYSNIDILSCATTAGQGAAVQIIGGSNNLYFRGLRVEQCPQGCISLTNSLSIFIEEGKCDQGFIPQSFATIQVDLNSQLNISDYSITGSNGVFPIITAGSLTLDNVFFTGGTNTPAHILDNRKWVLINNITQPTYSFTYWGPLIQPLKLGTSRFDYAHPSVTNVTKGAVLSNQGLLTVLNQVTVTSNGAVSGSGIIVGTNLSMTVNNQYIGCWLVHGPTGTQSSGEAGSRRKITQCFIGGNIVVQGTVPMTVDADWTLEYCGGHYTPIESDEANLVGPISLFSPIAISDQSSSGATLTGGTYIPALSGVSGNPGVTQYTISAGMILGSSINQAGYYLVDDITGEPYLIQATSPSAINVYYDTTGVGNPTYILNTAHTFSVISGNKSGVRINNGNFVWNFAGKTRSMSFAQANDFGYDINNMPLWITSIAPTPPVVTKGSFTATAGGVSGTVSGTVNYESNGDLVTISFPTSITGTSTANFLSMSGMPSSLWPTNNVLVPFGILEDNGSAVQTGAVTVIASSGAMSFSLSIVSGTTVLTQNTSFTGSGTKGVIANSQFTFSRN